MNHQQTIKSWSSSKSKNNNHSKKNNNTTKCMKPNITNRLNFSPVEKENHKNNSSIANKRRIRAPNQNKRRRQQQLSGKTKGPREDGAPRNHPEILSQKVADLERRFPYDSYGKNRAPFWPFLGEGLCGNIRRPLLLPAPLLYFRRGNTWAIAFRSFFSKYGHSSEFRVLLRKYREFSSEFAPWKCLLKIFFSFFSSLIIAEQQPQPEHKFNIKQ